MVHIKNLKKKRKQRCQTNTRHPQKCRSLKESGQRQVPWVSTENSLEEKLPTVHQSFLSRDWMASEDKAPWLSTTESFFPSSCTNSGSINAMSCCCYCQTLSHVNSLRPHGVSKPSFPTLHYLPQLSQTHIHRVSDAIQPSLPLSPHPPPALNPSQPQGLFQWVASSQWVAKVLELQL